MNASSFDLEAWLATNGPMPPIVQAGAEVLRRAALEVPSDLFGTPALDALVAVMVDVMREAPGVGLAAPQIGVPLRIFVAEDAEARMAHVSSEARAVRSRDPLALTVVVNPAVSFLADEQATFFEGCLSVRGYGALVARRTDVAVTGFDARGAPVSLRLHGWPARIAQHEMDHLNGTLYVDRMLSRSLANEVELARLAGLPVSEVLREIGEG